MGGRVVFGTPFFAFDFLFLRNSHLFSYFCVKIHILGKRVIFIELI